MFVFALLVAMGLTVLGIGAVDNAVASHDASSWLWNAARGELARVNGITARVSPLDLATLRITATTTTTAGGAAAGIDPERVRTEVVAPHSRDLTISTLTISTLDGVVVLDRTTGALTTLRGGKRQRVARDAPVSVTARERPDETVLVTLPAADGQGHRIARYVVTAVSAGARAPAGESGGARFVVPARILEYGTQYTFTVMAISERGWGSESSPTSDSVVPFTVPDRPAGLRATTVAGERGTVALSWAAPRDNGRPLTGYVVDAGGRRIEVTGTQATVGGLGDGENVPVSVQAVNAAGEAAAATGAAGGGQATPAVSGVATCRNGAEGATAIYRGLYVHNNDKRSTWWVRVEYSGRNYIPWAWLNLEGGDDIKLLPTC